MPATSRYSTPQGFHEIDINALRRDGFLVNGAVVMIRKSFGGRVIREATVRVLASVIKVDADGQTHVVSIEEAPQPFGGTRSWLTCPRCGRRAGKVYGAPFACRPCHRITYPSQRTDARGRAIMRAQKLRQRLGGTASLIDPLPDRPWGMWDRTYRRLLAKCGAADGKAIGFAAASLKSFKGRFVSHPSAPARERCKRA